MKVFFATNRNYEDGSFGKRFNQNGPECYRVGTAEVKYVDNDYQTISYEVLGETTHKDEAHFVGSDSLFHAIQEEMHNSERDIILYLHGFANTFENTLARAGQLSDLYEISHKQSDGAVKSDKPLVFAFCWPSDGTIFPPWKYRSDRTDAATSGIAMARAFMRLINFLDESNQRGFQCKRRIHLVAHSMGNYALRNMLQKLIEEFGAQVLTPIFENVFLMAADEDDDALQPDMPHKLGLLHKLARHIHVYHSADDGALVISDKTKFNPDRLGYNGPKTFEGLSRSIVAIDCELVDKSEITHISHQYYRIRHEVINDVKAVLSGKRPSSIPNREIVEQGRRYKILLPKDLSDGYYAKKTIEGEI